LPTLISAERALSAGLTRDQIRHRVRSGRWVVIGQGMYRRSDWAPEPGLDEFARARIDHAHRAVAAARTNPGAVIGFHSAAVMHQLPLFAPLPDHVVLVAPPGHWYGRRPGLLIRRGSLRPEDVAGQGIRVTVPARTWVDVARTGRLADALSVGDGGLRLGRFEGTDLSQALERFGSGRGCRRADLALRHVTGARETPLESGSWAYFVEYRLPLPRMQVEFRDPTGRLIGRVDFYWERAGVIGECDGRLKYGSPATLYAEKRREDALRAEGHRVVRWGWQDLRDARLAKRLRRELT
jgi:hypothetical protein